MPARAIYYAAFHPRREFWLGWPTVKAIMANKVAPGLIDHYLAKKGYSGQLTDEPSSPDAPDNLFEPVPGPYGAHGRFDKRARAHSWERFSSEHRIAVTAGVAALFFAGLGALIRRATES